MITNDKIYITNSNCVTPLGFDVEANWNALVNGNSGIQLVEKYGNLDSIFASIIETELLDTCFKNISTEASFTKLEKMLIMALHPLVSKNPISDKSVLILSTTKGNISLLENENLPIEATQLSTLAKKINTFFGFTTEPIVVSNACVSGVLAVSVAKRMLQMNCYEDAYVIAGDEISEFVLSGFNSFQAMSDKPCAPYDANRNGVTLGEASAAVYISKVKEANNSIAIIGDGSINDANHISGPSRTGEGLYKSIKSALQEAKLEESAIDYISAHGTATLYNDEMEAIAFTRSHLQNVPVNSLKGFFGHTLGASGLLEVVLAIKAANHNQLVASKGFVTSGVTVPMAILNENKSKKIKYFLKTASGFGGCNTAVVFEKIN